MERILGDQDYWPNWGLTMTQQGKTGFWFQWQVINWSSALKDVNKEVQHLVSFPPMLPFWGRERINIHQIKTKTAIHQLQGRGSFSCQPLKSAPAQIFYQMRDVHAQTWVGICERHYGREVREGKHKEWTWKAKVSLLFSRGYKKGPDTGVVKQ